MKERLKKILSVSPLKIAVSIIFIALVLFFIDAPFPRLMELNALDLRMVSRGSIPAEGDAHTAFAGVLDVRPGGCPRPALPGAVQSAEGESPRTAFSP